MKDINSKFKDLSERLQKEILREVRKSTAGIGTSYFDDKNNEGKNTLGSSEIPQEILDLINRKVDKTDFRDFAHKTINKNEYEYGLT